MYKISEVNDETKNELEGHQSIVSEDDMSNTDLVEKTLEGDSEGLGTAGGGITSSEHGRAYWQLSNGHDGTNPTMDIVVPKGTVAEVKGREVLLFREEQPQAELIRNPSDLSADGENVTPVGKVRLPVSVARETCINSGRTTDDGGRVLSCELGSEDVKKVPIQVVNDEL